MKLPRKNWALKFSTLIVVTACFVVMTSALVVTQNFRDIVTMWGDEVQMTVYLSPEISLQGKDFIENKLRDSQKIADVQFVNQEQALHELRGQLASYAPDVARDDELLHLIPSSLRVRLKSDVKAEEQTLVFEGLAKELRSFEGVDEVSYGQDWIEKYAAVVSAIQMTIHFIGLIVVAASLFVISNSIRASIHSRKEEVVVMEMVGATPFRIRKPFILEGASLGMLSSVWAVILTYGLFMGLMNIIEEKLSFFQLAQHLQFLQANHILLFIIGGTMLGALASYLCVRRLNDGFASLQGN
jgi:cell division transport system permease protein